MPSVNVFIFLFCLSSMTVANEHEAPPPEHGAPPGGHGGAAATEAAYSGKQSQQWSEVQAKLAALKAKVDAQEAVVKSLIPGNHHGGGEAPAGGGHESAPPPPAGEHGASDAGEKGAGSAATVGGPFEKLKKEEEKLKTLTVEYSKLNNEYETKFPEKGIKENRIYKRLDPQSTDAIEMGANVYEVRQQQLQNKIFRQYPKSAQKIKKAKLPGPTQQAVRAGDANGDAKHAERKSHPVSSDVTEQIILQK